MKAVDDLCLAAGYNVIGKLVLIDLLYLHKPANSIKSVILQKK